ncbi:MAG: pirin family protein [Sphingomonadales bacterium]|nr:pirin family protein [Sphingomonadales bacterium]
MIELRPFDGIGAANHGWLDAHHHFSFGTYHDPARTNWGRLRVWNDDTIAPKSGFPPHPHNDMEIVTYVRTGAITHRDSLGNEGRTEAGDVQVMSAAGWGARPFPRGDRAGKFVTLASGMAGDEDALPINTSGRVLGATVKAGDSVTYATTPDRHLYLVAAEGRIKVDAGASAVEADPRDGVAITGENSVTVTALITCTSPASVRPSLPRLSRWVIAPVRT